MSKANGGIGFELASQLLTDSSKHVLFGSRSVEKGKAALKDLQSRKLPGSVELLQLDVDSVESFTAAAKSVESKHSSIRLDALVNNAAIADPKGSLNQQMSQCFQTNATGPLTVLETFVPLLKKSNGAPHVVIVSSAAGCISMRLSPKAKGYEIKVTPYRASKAALHMITACQIADYGGLGFKIFIYSPGLTDSNLGPYNKVEFRAQPTSEGAAPIVTILSSERDEEEGMHLNATGQTLW